MLTKNEIMQLLTSEINLPQDQIEELDTEQRKNGGSFEDLVLERKLFSSAALLYFESRRTKVPIIKLSACMIAQDISQIIPEKIARHYRAIPISRIENYLTVAMSDPINLMALDALRNASRCEIIPVLAGNSEMEKMIEALYSGTFQIDDLLQSKVENEALQLLEQVSEDAGQGENPEEDKAPAIRIISITLQRALKERASDIHFEAYENSFRIRFRVDGMLREYSTPPSRLHGAIMSRIKIMSNLDITERRVPQDGRFRIKLQSKEIDFRVSILPMVHGEKCVMRILDKTNVAKGLDKLGYNAKPLAMFHKAIKHPHGMILVTGPTGSGKSTTLYAVLNELNTPERNIMTVEDPVEYQVEGISQTQVIPEIDFTFSKGLRSLLRQSPDIILVGEIRDAETADIAVKASLTGHLVLSTLHTNDAAGAFTRLIDMGIEPFLVSSSVILVSAQRLCRRLCEKCKIQETKEDLLAREDRLRPDDLEDGSYYRAKGCLHCRNTGYSGRAGLMETLLVEDKIRQLIFQRQSSSEIRKHVSGSGFISLFEDGLELMKKGITSSDEIFRISGGRE